MGEQATEQGNDNDTTRVSPDDDGDDDDDDDSSSSSGGSTSESAASSCSADGHTSVSVTPADTPIGTPVISPFNFDCTPFVLSPFPPPPADESTLARAARQTLELREALLHLHAEVSTADSADARVFLEPVDEAFAPCYFEVVKIPMDLSTIGRKIAEDEYPTAWEYMEDFQTMIDNCLAYNKAGTFHNRYAQKFLKSWAPKVENLCLNTLAHHDYCCGKRRTLSGFAYRCRGATCFIRYGCVFWSFDPSDGDDEIVYCQSHYQRLAAEVTIPRYGNGTGGDVTFKKIQLGRSRHKTPLVSENFLECVECGHRDHEICKLHQSWVSPAYHCDRCRKNFGLTVAPVPSPRDLPECHLSRALEKETSCKVPLVGQRVCIRVVDHERERVDVKPMMKARYPQKVFDFPYVKKVVLCFMDIEGRPVCFFGMILHEYGGDCAEPNRGRCYLSLLDSVKLPKTMLPSAYRTSIYHAVVRGYLREAGCRGFKACHIYTCPPRKGQNYIFPFKPDDQKEISIIRLRKWYADILTHSQICEPPAIHGFKNIGDVYPKPALTEIPYFDGDNWPDILEDILTIDNTIKETEREKEEKRLRVEALAIANAPTPDKTRSHIKPEPLLAGHFAGTAPPKKRRKTETKRPPKPKLTVEGRLHVVMTSSKRDFLVVELVRPNGEADVTPDPDAAAVLATTGTDHTVGTFLRTEKLEFSSLRHAKFSTMLLIHALLADKLPPERYPDTKDSKEDGAGPVADVVGTEGGAGAAVAVTPGPAASAPVSNTEAEVAKTGAEAADIGAEADGSTEPVVMMEVVEPAVVHPSEEALEDGRPVEPASSDAMEEDLHDDAHDDSSGESGGGGAGDVDAVVDFDVAPDPDQAPANGEEAPANGEEEEAAPMSVEETLT